MSKARAAGTFFFAGMLVSAMAAGAYWLGYRHGAAKHGQAPPVAMEEGATMSLPASATSAPAVTPSVTRETPQHELQTLLDAKAWYRLEQWLTANRERVTAAHGAALVTALGASANKYDARAMRQVLSAYLDAVPQDPAALFLLADLKQISGMPDSALDTLLELLTLPLDAALIERARGEADRIMQVIDAQLRNRGAAIEREAFWRRISERVPASDRYRYEWAGALADLKRWPEARRVLVETGTTDIEQTVIDALADRIALAEQDLSFTRDGDKLLSHVAGPSGLTFTLLVDTGANITSFSRQALRTLGARRTRQSVQIRTAGGIVETGVYRVARLEVQGQYFDDVRVLELPVELPGLDGLLGLDIIHRLEADPLRLNR